MLQRVADSQALRFHMPGHKGLVELPGAPFDLTELGGTDELFDPQGGILQAQQEAAACWGAVASFLLVNGSTAGVQAMILWASMQQRTLLLPRDCHISAIYACALADVQPEWLMPQWNAGEQITLWDMGPFCSQPPNEKSAILLTYPDYYGRCIDIPEIKSEIGSRDTALLCDSAHGAHFIFSDRLPQDAGNFAELWVAGAHKTLPAPTQTAFLHVKRQSDADAVSRLLRGITTTSPSFVLMAGLDNSRLMMQQSSGALEELITNSMVLRQRLNDLDGLRCWDERTVQAQGYAAQDPTRLVVDVHGLGLTGWQAAAELLDLSISVEMADLRRVVLILTILDEHTRLETLYRAFLALSNRVQRQYTAKAIAPPARGEAVMTIRQAWLSMTEDVALDDAAGRVAAEPFGAYPPGVALAAPGEVITPEAVETARQSLALGGSLFGPRQGRLSVVAD
jgi:arginine decarboxylase